MKPNTVLVIRRVRGTNISNTEVLMPARRPRRLANPKVSNSKAKVLYFYHELHWSKYLSNLTLFSLGSLDDASQFYEMHKSINE